MKRHNFGGGGRATHGNSVSHRSCWFDWPAPGPPARCQGQEDGRSLRALPASPRRTSRSSRPMSSVIILIQWCRSRHQVGYSGSKYAVKPAALPENSAEAGGLPCLCQGSLKRLEARPARERNNGYQDHNACRPDAGQGSARRDLRSLILSARYSQRVVRCTA